MSQVEADTKVHYHRADSRAMNCPACHKALKQMQYKDICIDICSKCRGIWFDAREMGEFIGLLLEKGDLPDDKIAIDKVALKINDLKEETRACPKCNCPLNKLNYGYDSNIMIDRCPSCEGVWTDKDEIRSLAIYVKGNPKLTSLGRAIADNQSKAYRQKELIDSAAVLSIDARLWVFFPKIILPLGDNIRPRVFPYVGTAIILANILMFIYQVFYTPDVAGFLKEFGMIPLLISSGENMHTLLSSMFMHGGLGHLLGNMLFFWIFADNVEDILGHARFLAYYLAFGFFASLIHILSDPDSTLPAIGASGAIAGIMGAYLVFYPYAQIRTLVITRIINIPSYLYIGGWFAIQLLWATMYSTMGMSEGIAWYAHIGGFVAGLSLAWYHEKRKNRDIDRSID